MPAPCTLTRRCRPSNIRTSRLSGRAASASHMLYYSHTVSPLHFHRSCADRRRRRHRRRQRSGDAKIISSRIYPLFGARRRPVNNTVARTPSAAFRFARPPPGSRLSAGSVTVARLSNRVCFEKGGKRHFFLFFCGGIFSPIVFGLVRPTRTDRTRRNDDHRGPHRRRNPPQPAERVNRHGVRSQQVQRHVDRPTWTRNFSIVPGVCVCVCVEKRALGSFSVFFLRAYRRLKLKRQSGLPGFYIKHFFILPTIFFFARCPKKVIGKKKVL